MKQFRTKAGVFEADASDILGKGTYGTVYKVRHRDNPQIKKAIKTFVPETLDENEGVPSTTLREVNAVKTVNHPNVMSVQEVVFPQNNSLKDMFIVMELCRGTLKEKIQHCIQTHLNSDPMWLNPPSGAKLPAAYMQEAKLMAWQVLNAVAVCHSRGIMHRDLKPANILWSNDDLLKIGDFGLARFVRGVPISKDHLVPQTGEVQTMWYRAPEVLLGDEQYGMLVDDWSLGCVVAEMFRFRISTSKRMESDPLFAGRGDVHTLMLIFEALGTPKNDEYLKTLPYWTNCFPNWPPGALRKKVKLVDDLGYDLICQLLTLSPRDRKATRFLLNHPWFNDVRSIINQRYVPWYRGYEQEFMRLLEIDRMPDAQPLPAPQPPQENAAPPNDSRPVTATTASSQNNSRPGSGVVSQAGQKKKRDRSSSTRSRNQENNSGRTQNAAPAAGKAGARRNASASSRNSAKGTTALDQFCLVNPSQTKLAAKREGRGRKNEDVKMSEY
eukprot:Gregarina_sp_Poly_1__10436@NODE_754_length_6432_cov_237_128358_g558_i0_p2_GENE_NODE_754_length_6432_cov_237_128358_g558_i0NODE_754_length_6432_cov_237_128358_g558_i0_p2_ORF_typecomplete_len498_score60_08Pkinase/PF00069_25/2_3e49Pkinase_Tyr/PF07714_17/2_9e33Kinaselike/PF14531_6/1_5e08Kdo/PF06293_14/3_8e08Pkinase_fungal/PF17667_1/2_8e05RIO1/PF01163_22/0_00029APH/PF01636_23/0_0015FTA2/PF13095_6/2_3FTA2/PF13095_6/1_3Haspin_kinase/PF12330_8/0_058WaaY/PF06176_11/1_9e03WaaY/PF06176_11/0_011_NODE_754_le